MNQLDRINIRTIVCYLHSLKRTLLLAVAISLLGGCAVNNTTFDSGISNLMLKGFDPVSYFGQDKPVKEQLAFQQEYEYGTYLFATDQNLQKFAANPDKYVPQYGGFCSKGVSYYV